MIKIMDSDPSDLVEIPANDVIIGTRKDIHPKLLQNCTKMSQHRLADGYV